MAAGVGASLGGNGSLVGASANLIVAGFAAGAGQRIPFMSFMSIAFPLNRVNIATASVHVYPRYL